MHPATLLQTEITILLLSCTMLYLGGTSLWSETQTINVVDGIINTNLGTLTSLPQIQFCEMALWLGITVGTGSELTPRISLTSVPYSFMSMNVVDNSITTSKIVDGAVTQDKLNPGCSLPPGGTAGGDLGGMYPNPLVTKLQGFNISNTSPQNEQVLKWTGTYWTPATDEVGTTGGPAGGDLSGTYPNPTVVKLQGRNVLNTAPTNGQVIKWNGSNWTPSEDISGGAPSGSAGGDLSGTYPGPTVSKLLGRTLSTTTPTNGQVLSWSGTQWTPTTPTSGMGGSGTSSYLPKFTSGSTIGNSMLYESGGKLGINNTTLQYKLELGNTSENINHLRINSSQWGGLLFYNGTGDASGGITYGHLTNSLFFYTKPDGGTMTSRIALDKNGNLGIGTNNPTYKLELGEITDANNYVRVNSSSNGGLLCYDGEGYASGLIAYNHVNDRFNFYTRNGSDFQLKMVLNKYGRVGLGIVDPGAKLQVVATEKYAGNFSSDSLSINTHVIHSEFTGSGYYDAKAVYGYSKPAVEFGYGGFFEGGYAGVYGSGKYGVYGYANVGGSIRYGIYGRALGGSTNYAVYANGDLAYTGNLINASDIMFKQNINSFSALNKISQLEPRVFSYTSDSRYTHMNLPSGNHYGLIAQDLEKVFPELVIDAIHPSAEETRGERGGEEIHYKGVKYMELVPILIQAVQEQQKIIEELTRRIEELERR